MAKPKIWYNIPLNEIWLREGAYNQFSCQITRFTQNNIISESKDWTDIEIPEIKEIKKGNIIFNLTNPNIKFELIGTNFYRVCLDFQAVLDSSHLVSIKFSRFIKDNYRFDFPAIPTATPPIDNRSNSTCYWCGKPTVVKQLWSSFYYYCKACKK